MQGSSQEKTFTHQGTKKNEMGREERPRPSSGSLAVWKSAYGASRKLSNTKRRRSTWDGRKAGQEDADELWNELAIEKKRARGSKQERN